MDFIKHYFFTDQEKLKTITEFLESKEEYILQKYKFRGDFGTSLTDKHVSTRSGGYNIFQFSNECPELNNLLAFLIFSYQDYMKNVIPKNAYTGKLNPALNCWVNIMRDSESIGRHRHSEDYSPSWSFVSASIILRAKNTCTRYSYKGEEFASDNVNGCLTIFPPYYDHWTDEHKDTSHNRVTLGMDFFFDKEHSAGFKEFYDTLITVTLQ